MGAGCVDVVDTLVDWSVSQCMKRRKQKEKKIVMNCCILVDSRQGFAIS